MRHLWLIIGRIGYYILRPFVGQFIKDSKRTRVLIRNGDRVLLVRNWLGDGTWVLPGGGLHKLEDSKQGAVREVLEETGLQLSTEDLKFVGTETHTDKVFKFSYDLYLASTDQANVTRPQRFEISDVAWKSMDDIGSLRIGTEVSKALVTWSKQR